MIGRHVLIEGLVCVGFAVHAALCYACEPSHAPYAWHMFALNMGLLVIHPVFLTVLELVSNHPLSVSISLID